MDDVRRGVADPGWECACVGAQETVRVLQAVVTLPACLDGAQGDLGPATGMCVAVSGVW